MKLREVIKNLETLAPLSLAESWDNVGLLIDPCTFPGHDIKRALTTIDLTEQVVEEAANKTCSLIISYHPPIFKSFKRLLQTNNKDRIIMKCISRGITVYSPHTCWDSMENGVNDWLGSCFEAKSKFSITPNNSVPNAGMGRILTLATALPLTEVCDILQNHLEVKHLRLGHADYDQWIERDQSKQYDMISTIGICAGSGGSLLNGVNADLYITGEMSHHEVLAVIAEGRNVLLSEHTHTERGFLKSVVEMLHVQTMNSIEFIVSEADCNPIQTIDFS